MNDTYSRREVLRRGGLAGMGLVLGGGLLSACADSGSSASGASSPSDDAAAQAGGGGRGGSAKLVLLAPLTGAAAGWGPLQADGFRRAVQMVNDSGGIQTLDGMTIDLEVLDTETKPEVAASQAERAAGDENTVMITGCNQSGSSIVVAQVAHRNGVSFVTGTDADPLITEQGSEFSFRLPGSTEVYPRDMLEWVKFQMDQTGTDANKLAVLSSSSQLGQVANQFAEQHAQRLGFDIVAIETYDTASVQDFTPFISRYKSAGVQTFLGTHDPEPGVLIMRAIKQQDYRPVVFGGMYGTIGTADWIEAVGEDGNGAVNAYGWSFNVKGLGMEEFIPDFESKFDRTPDNFDAPGFAVVSTFVDALERAGSTDRVAVRDAVRATKLGPAEGTLPLLQMNGAEFDDKGANIQGSTFVETVKDGATYAVYPEEYATAEAPFPWQPA